MTDTFEEACKRADAKAADQYPQPVARPSWREGLITAKDLQSKSFAPVRIIVPGLIPEGVTILAGKPKIGKSWLALDICAAIAGDRFVLGETKPVQGDVLYLALEDNQRRLKKRTDKIMQGATAPERLEIRTEWRRVDQGGLDDLREWCEAHPERRLIWIDTFTKIRPLAARNEQAYCLDYRSIEGLQELAGEFQVAIVLNHHLRKAASEDDAFDDVSGTLGLTGAADTIVILKRHSGMVKIFVRGRDIEEAELAAEFNRETCRWRLVGEADEVFRSEQRQAIAAALKDAKQPMSISEIMAVTERRDRHATENLLYKMEKTGDAKRIGRGQWTHPDPTDPDPLDPVGFVGSLDSTNHPFEKKGESTAKPNGKPNAIEPVGFRVGFSEITKPLKNEENPSQTQQPNDPNGSERKAPPQGEGWRPAGEIPPGKRRAKVWICQVPPQKTRH